jgi:antitoxin (DNA-binding transcriptional repressor) of toxin-antitoxin stability system
MRTIGLVEAKRKFSELVDRASTGESTGILREGKLVAVIAPIFAAGSLRQAFADIDKIRKRAKPLRGLTMRNLIEEGRR